MLFDTISALALTIKAHASFAHVSLPLNLRGAAAASAVNYTYYHLLPHYSTEERHKLASNVQEEKTPLLPWFCAGLIPPDGNSNVAFKSEQ